MDMEKLQHGASQDAEVNKVLEALFSPKAETNANEVEHTSNTGYGAELIPTNVFADSIMEMVQERSRLLPMLPGDHGTGLAISQKVPVIGELGTFKGNSEWTTGAGTIDQGNTLAPTGSVTITQGEFKLSIDVSKRELNYASDKLESILKERIALSMADTIDALILNGDSETGATGNVNSDDGAPASTSYYLQNDGGVRELGINGSGTSVNVGTLAIADFISTMNVLGDFMASPEDCLWVFNRATYNKALGLADFADAAQRGEKATTMGGAITNVFGSDVLIAKHMPKTEADGKVSTTPANNTLGQFGLIYKPSIQYGFGQPLELDVVKVPGKGISLIATFEFGFAIAQKIAGYADSSVAVGYNVTL